MLFTAFQISANHIQMSYYFLFVMLFMVIAFGVDAFRKKELPDFLKATGVLLVAGLIGVAANASSLYHTYEYSKETIRGKSELTHHGDQHTGDGLERDYITAWSYGIGETWTLLVPNTREVPRRSPRTNGPWPKHVPNTGIFTPRSVGTGVINPAPPDRSREAFVLMLFILGLFIVKGPLKWALARHPLLHPPLLGKNMMGLTDFFIDHVPLYNKFRAVSSILVIAEFCIPLLAALTIKEIAYKPELLKNNIKALYISLGLTGGIALLFALLPKLFFSSFVSASEMQALQSLPPEHIQPILANLTDMRVGLFTADAWRSFFIVAIGSATLWLFMEKKIRGEWMVAAILLLSLIDLWGVNKRYLSDDDFVASTQTQQQFTLTPTDQMILQDSTLYYRVLNMATSTFNDGVTPYHHKVIGGYHAAKLRRYQDLIDRHLTTEMGALQQAIIGSGGVLDSVNADPFKVLNMLNTRWVIMPAQGGGTIPVLNPHAMGNAWFVDEIRFVESADEEIETIGMLNLHHAAIADKKFEPLLDGLQVTPADSASTIRLLEYDSDYLIYEADAKKDELAVFSEIYYPKGWQITIDGKPAAMLR